MAELIKENIEVVDEELKDEQKVTKDQCKNIVDFLLKFDAKQLKAPKGTHKMYCANLGAELEFEIKGVDPEKLDNIKMNAMEMKKGDVKNIRMFDMKAETIIASCDVFTNATYQTNFEVYTPEDLLKKLLRPGEIDELYAAINKLMGFDTEDEEDKVKEVKN